MSSTYILIDFENVHPTATECVLIRGAQYRVRLFHGPHQNRIPVDVAKALQPLGLQVEYIQCEKHGKNALDFHIAFYLGRLVQESEGTPLGKGTIFFVVSKDGGFDALLDHIRELGYAAARVTNIQEALGKVTATEPVTSPTSIAKTPPTKKPAAAKVQPATKKAKPAAPVSKKVEKPDAWSRAIEHLRDHPNNRPTTIKRLASHLVTLFAKEKSPDLVGELMARLQREGVAVLEGKRIAYKIPKV